MPIDIEQVVLHSHVSKNTKIHALYNFFYHHKTVYEIAHIYAKKPGTIRNWINQFKKTGSVSRLGASSVHKFTAEHRLWIRQYFFDNPLSFLDEAKAAFKAKWQIPISVSTVWKVLNAYGMRWKAVERRAMHIKEAEIMRFMLEINSLDWTMYNTVFLDEVSFDNRGMVRRCGYAMKGEKLLVRGDYQRLPRVSILSFIGCNGTLENYSTEGTFDRRKFTECCRKFALHSGKVKQYPGQNSIWILDGAAIHRSADLI
ncbi:Serine kinase, partial [Chytriomyces hyalinus]